MRLIMTRAEKMQLKMLQYKENNNSNRDKVR